MRKLTKPTRNAGETFALCISRVRNAGLRGRLGALRQKVETATDDYDVKATRANWHSIAKSGGCDGISRQDLINIYKNRMAKPGAPGRSIYDELIIVPQRRCPLCGQRDVSTLDHYLPEAHYSLLVVSPINLVPSCKDCNFNKRAAVPTCSREQMFHPYYDNFDDAVWLGAKLMNVNPVVAVFEVLRPPSWSPIKVKRARHHYKTLKLGELYSANAAGELIEIKHRLDELYRTGGKEAVREDLASRASSITCVYPNSWRGAIYTAAATTDWFCDRGFEFIAS